MLVPSSAMYVVYRGDECTMFQDPIGAFMGMFIMSLGEFAKINASFKRTAVPVAVEVHTYAVSLNQQRIIA